MSPASCDSYCTEYVHWDHHTDRKFLIKWVWHLSDRHHHTVPNRRLKTYDRVIVHNYILQLYKMLKADSCPVKRFFKVMVLKS